MISSGWFTSICSFNAKFWNTLFHLHRQVWRWNRHSVLKRWHLNYKRRWITQKKAYDIQNMAKCLKPRTRMTCFRYLRQHWINISVPRYRDVGTTADSGSKTPTTGWECRTGSVRAATAKFPIPEPVLWHIIGNDIERDLVSIFPRSPQPSFQRRGFGRSLHKPKPSTFVIPSK
jgi:hypothetical protein